MNFMAGFYGFRHLVCEGTIQIERVGVNENDMLVVYGSCRKCGEQDVATLIPLRNLKKCASELRNHKLVPIALTNEFSIKDRNDLHSMGISLPDDQRLLNP
jgi:hypothetical protein